MNKELKQHLIFYLDDLRDSKYSLWPNTCEDIDCNKFSMRDSLKKPFDIVDHRDCLEHNKKHRKYIEAMMRDPLFNEVTIKPCGMCKKKFHQLDLFIDSESKPVKFKGNKGHELKTFHMCKRCWKRYDSDKSIIMYEGFKRWP
jgi:hypothetical protein